MGDHLEIIIFCSILLILLNSLISLSELHKTPSTLWWNKDMNEWIPEAKFVHIGDQTWHCFLIISRLLWPKRAAGQNMQIYEV